ncbi:uncharacterized protein [Epargyreus clarus]|uniref:uncharacterized protein n=1 Tax=Epargyreus clarus TaxID=520877 RepID=UPI003C2FF02D
MEVSRSKWVSKATDNINRYLHRGGHLKGDEPQLLGGVSLLNTIGVAMGLPPTDPEDWTRSEMKKALKGNLVYFEGAARDIIDVIADQIRNCCGGDAENYVTVLPIEVYTKGILIEVPLFRVHRYKDSQKYYIDTIGRYYESFSDWFHTNKLPPGKMAYPYKLRLELHPGYDYLRVVVRDTPSARDAAEIVDTVDTIATVAEITSTAGLLFIPGGLAAPARISAGTASALWGIGRTTYQIVDKAIHGESLNPVTNAESRALWLGLAVNVVDLGAKGATRRLLARGRAAPNSTRAIVNGINRTHLTLRGIKICDETLYTIAHYDEVSLKKVLMLGCSIAFWTKDVYDFKTADVLIEESYE